MAPWIFKITGWYLSAFRNFSVKGSHLELSVKGEIIILGKIYTRFRIISSNHTWYKNLHQTAVHQNSSHRPRHQSQNCLAATPSVEKPRLHEQRTTKRLGRVIIWPMITWWRNVLLANENSSTWFEMESEKIKEISIYFVSVANKILYWWLKS